MKTAGVPVILVLAAFLVATCSGAVQPTRSTEKLDSVPGGNNNGNVSFATSCDAQVNESFQTAIAYLYSFWFPPSQAIFTNITQRDPLCCMAYWGSAQTLLHPIWDFPTDRLAAGWDLMQQAQQCVQSLNSSGRSITDRELSYINSAYNFFQPQDVDNADRLRDYASAMEKIFIENAETDENSIVLYGLSLMAVGYYIDDSTQGYINEKKTFLLETLVTLSNPNNPGALHFVIHSMDQPGFASNALWAADRYGSVAPAVPHALHMPSHIYVDLGKWEEAISANRDSMNRAFEDANETMNHDWIHASNFLSYSYLQLALDDYSEALVQSYPDLDLVDPQYDDAARVICHYLIETRQWQVAAEFVIEDWIPDSKFNWTQGPYVFIYSYFTQLIGRIETNQTADAPASYQNMLLANQSLGWPDWELTQLPYWRDSFTGLLNSGAAWIEWISDRESGIEMMESVVEYQDNTFQPEIGHLLSAREQIARMYEMQGNFSAALDQYQKALEKRPDRFWLLYGAGNAAQQLQLNQTAFEFFSKLVLLANANYTPPVIDGVVQPSANSTKVVRPAVQQAEAFVKTFLASALDLTSVDSAPLPVSTNKEDSSGGGRKHLPRWSLWAIIFLLGIALVALIFVFAIVVVKRPSREPEDDFLYEDSLVSDE